MVSKTYLHEFLFLLNKAGDDELQARKDLLHNALRDHTLSRDMRADCNFLLRKIQEEQMARAEVKMIQRFRKEA